MIIILLSFYILLLALLYKSKSVSVFFVLIQILSLIGALLINLVYPIENLFTVFNILLLIVLTSLIILPWRKICNVEQIVSPPPIKVKYLTTFLLFVNAFVFVVFAITTYFVTTLVEDINEFKYAEGISTDFYYSLPYGAIPIILSTNLYPLSYFLIPLHFYYLSKGQLKMSLICLLFSLNSVLYGMTFFSRSVYVHYFFIYLGMLWIMYGTLSLRYKAIIKKAFIFFSLVVGIFFISITISRFSDNPLYENDIPSDSPIQDPALYSLFDYLSQGYYNGVYVLDFYSFKTFNGQIAFQPLLALLGQYKVIKYDPQDYTFLRRKLWPEHYYKFVGFAAYTVFDFGYTIAFLFCFIYYYLVSRCRPKQKIIRLENLFIIVLLIQLPLMSIFYSTTSTIIFASLYTIPIFCYLGFTLKLKKHEIT